MLAQFAQDCYMTNVQMYFHRSLHMEHCLPPHVCNSHNYRDCLLH